MSTDGVTKKTDLTARILGLNDRLSHIEALEKWPVLDEDDFASDSDAHLATQQSIKSYVDNHGWTGDKTTNFTSSDDYDDINPAIDALDKYIPHGYKRILQFGDGIYALTGRIIISGFYGPGTLAIYGNTGESETTLHANQAVDIDADALSTNAIFITECDCPIEIHNIKIRHNSNSGHAGLYVNHCSAKISVLGCYVDGDGTGAAGGNGFEFLFCPWVYVRACYAHNNRTGITAGYGTYLVSRNNDEYSTAPAYGLYATGGGIKRVSTQPSGSTANTTTNNGGTID